MRWGLTWVRRRRHGAAQRLLRSLPQLLFEGRLGRRLARCLRRSAVLSQAVRLGPLQGVVLLAPAAELVLLREGELCRLGCRVREVRHVLPHLSTLSDLFGKLEQTAVQGRLSLQHGRVAGLELRVMLVLDLRGPRKAQQVSHLLLQLRLLRFEPTKDLLHALVRPRDASAPHAATEASSASPHAVLYEDPDCPPRPVDLARCIRSTAFGHLRVFLLVT